MGQQGSSVGHSNRGSVDHRMGNSVDHRGSVDHGGSMVSRGSVGNSLGISSGAVVGDLSNVAIVVVDMVVHMLDPAVGKSHRVRSLGLTGAVAGLSSVEVGVGVVVSNGVVVGVGRDLIGINLMSNSVGNRSMVSRGGVNHRSVVGRGSMDHRGSVHHRGSMNYGSSMNQRGSVTDNSMGESVSNNSLAETVPNHTVGEAVSSHKSMASSMKNIGRVSNSSDGGSEGLGLGDAPVLSLEGLGH